MSKNTDGQHLDPAPTRDSLGNAGHAKSRNSAIEPMLPTNTQGALAIEGAAKDDWDCGREVRILSAVDRVGNLA